MKDNTSTLTDEITKEEALYHLLKKERAYYLSLLEIARQENALLQIPAIIPGWRAITPLLKNKRVLLGCIQEIEHTLAPLKTHWQNKICRADSLSQKIQHELEALNLLLEEILQLDLASQKQMEKQLAKLKEHASRPTP